MKGIEIGTEFISKFEYPFGVESTDEDLTDISLGETCKVISKSETDVTLLNISLGVKDAWVTVSFNDLMKLQGLPVAEDDCTYISVWIDEDEKWYYFKNEFDKSKFIDGYVDYYITVKDGIITKDTYKTANKGKAFYEVCDINRWN